MVVENRDYISRDHAMFLIGAAWKRTVQGINFWTRERSRPVWYMRQEMIKQALESKSADGQPFSHFVFIDTDVMVPTGWLTKLLSHDIPLVSGVYYTDRGHPVNRKFGVPFIGVGLMEVDVFSMGLSLIKREVLEKVPYPAPEPITKPDADIEWCQAVQAAGYKVMQDFDVRGSHLILGEF